MPRLSLYLLGQPQLELDDAPVKFDSRKTVALLVYLSVSKERQYRDTLIGLLWPNFSQSSARTSLRHSLYSINRILGAQWLDVDRESVVLNPDSEVWSDVDEFLERSSCKSHGHSADQVCPKCVPSLTTSVDLYRDDFLRGFSLKDSVGFDDWQFFQTENLRRALAGSLDRLVQALSLQWEFDRAITFAQRWLAQDPLDELVHSRLMKLYVWAGKRSRALHQYQECVKILKDEVDAVPLKTTTENTHKHGKEKAAW
jgi:DNA-binding SARP family transcriptional activator